MNAVYRSIKAPWLLEARRIWGPAVDSLLSESQPSAPRPAPAIQLQEHPEQQRVGDEAAPPRKPDTRSDPCFVCGTRPTTGSKHKLCGGCKLIVYCSKECQAKHWKEGGHKQDCSKIHMNRS